MLKYIIEDGILQDGNSTTLSIKRLYGVDGNGDH
jgi:hypothetical protein